jgi:hypothetical protein
VLLARPSQQQASTMPSLAVPMPILGESSEVSVWRREPYRVLFPAGALFAVVGTLPWVLFAAGAISAASSSPSCRGGLGLLLPRA